MKTTEHYDALVIGSGAGGGATAWALSRAGLRVLVLEAGPRFDPHKDYRLDQPDWELHKFPAPKGARGRYTYGAMQKLEARWRDILSWNQANGRMVRSATRATGAYHHVRGVGGSTLHFSGEAQRINPEAMQMHSRFGVAADWPLSYAELEPYYQQAEAAVGVAGPAGDQRRPRSKPYPLPPHAFSYASQKVAAGCKKLGLGWQANSLAILSKSYQGRPPCNYCGNCARGCPRTDKGTVDVTFIRQAEATGRCTVLPMAQMTDFEVTGRDHIAGVSYVDAGGAKQQAQASLYVLAAGAIESPRLLLSATAPGHADGLANESGQVGRNFMETLFWSSHGLHPEALGSHRGLPVDGICWDYNAPDAIPDVVGGARFSITTAEAGLVGPVSYANRVVAGWGRRHKQAMRDTFGRVLGVGAIGESLPNARSFIDLDPQQRDGNGLPLARINSFLPDSELLRLRFMAKQSRDILQASGVEKIFEEYGTYDQFSATHVFGTCRMGNNPETSVVNADCRSHRWKNLYITDASVFPSSGGGESPSLTIQALAIRAAGRMREALQRRDA